MAACPGSGTAHVHYRGADLYCEDLALGALADRFGTPLYVYSAGAVRERVGAVRAAFGPHARICYAVKANGNRALLRLLAGLGCGFDVVSGGELLRLQAAGLDARTAVFAGVAKEAWEIELGVRAGVRAFHVEGESELDLLAAAAQKARVRVPVLLRLNPGVDVSTHAYIATARRDSKFGVPLAAAGALVERIAAEPMLELRGYHVHLGSQLRAVEPYLAAFAAVEGFLGGAEVRRRGVREYDLGGGFGLAYGEGEAFDAAALARALLPRLRARGLEPVLEPGRYLVGDAGVLLCTAVGGKQAGATSFLLVDAAMNDLLRPALYGAVHPLAPVRRPVPATPGPNIGPDIGALPVDVVGPVCESGDFLARNCALPPVQPGERVAVLGAGAYGFSMASNYNSRRLPAEVMVDGGEARLVRRRQEWSQLWADEVDPT